MEDNDKHLSGEEKRAKMKEAYLKDLRLRKEFLDKAQSQQYINNAMKALNEMENFSDDTDEWIAQLNGKSLLQEARLDMALQDPFAPQPPTTPEAAAATENPAPDAAIPDDDALPPTKTLGDEMR